MSWSVEISGKGLPDVHESVASFCQCPGNMYMCVLELSKKQLKDMGRKEAIAALAAVINELDKGDKGVFNDEYCKAADEKWSQGKETRDGWNKWAQLVDIKPDVLRHMPFKDYLSYCGYEVRERCRDAALRFFLYYKAGYNVTFTW